MPAVEKIHQIVKNSLIKDGWTISKDPLILKYGERNLFIDLGAEKLLEAIKDELKIAVEIKSFLGPSPVSEVQNALGQYLMYKAVIEEENIDRILVLALPSNFFNSFFKEPLGILMINTFKPNFMIIDLEKEEIIRWFPKLN